MFSTSPVGFLLITTIKPAILLHIAKIRPVLTYFHDAEKFIYVMEISSNGPELHRRTGKDAPVPMDFFSFLSGKSSYLFRYLQL